jgi:UDP-N-acetylmuramate dehydrogenase
LELINHASLKPFVTFGVEATCDHLYRVEDPEELKLAAQYLEQPLVLGGGSNVLPIGDIHRNVLRMELKGIEIIKEEGNDVWIRASAGELWHQVVLWAVERDLGGIENLSLIPGTIGASPIQNIGAYGVELVSVFESLEAVEIGTGALRTFTKAECGFGYRDSVFKKEHKGKYIISSVTLRLKRESTVNTTYGSIQAVLQERGITHPTIRDISNIVIEIRQSKLPDPGIIGNAGSFFKNPIIDSSLFESIKEKYPDLPGYPDPSGHTKIHAGWLIEKAGWKGKRFGDAGSYGKQSLVLVNYGNASGEEIWELAQQIIASVEQQFNITLHPEVNLWR